MKSLTQVSLILIAAAVMTLSSPAQAEVTSYGRTIVVPPASRPELHDAAADLAALLERITGDKWKVQSEDAPRAIMLRGPKSGDDVPGGLTKLKSMSEEAFLIRSEGKDRLWIAGNCDRAAGHGIYWYLEQLGCRFLGPTDAWTILPERPDVTINADTTQQPAFLVRGYFATGGFGGILPTDPDRHVQRQWDIWKRRTRWGGPFSLGGHAGEDFTTRNKAELEAHPEYLAEIDGKRLPFASGVKPCYSNPGAIALYVKDRLAKLGESIKRDPDGPQAFAVSVDPSDGGAHCACKDCLALGSISDRVFSLANHVARAVQKEYPGKYVSLYAYNEHAFVPAIDLEPNVYVMLVPYGLHRTGLTGEQFIEAWSKKVKRSSVYAYWTLTDWSNDLPATGALSKVPTQIRDWHQNGVESVAIQTTASTGGIGLTMYVSGKLLWDPTLSEEKLVRDYCTDAFGPASEPMFRMLSRWHREFLLSELELGQSFKDLADAQALNKDPQVQLRLDDMKRYLHYLRLWNEYQLTPGGSPERSQAANQLAAYLWRIYDSTMVHTYRMFVLLSNRYEQKDKTIAEAWPLKGKPEAWAQVKPLDAQELTSLMTEDAKLYPPMDLEARQFSDNLVPVNPKAKSDKQVGTPSLSGLVKLAVIVPPGARSFSFSMSVGKGNAGSAGDQVTFYRDGKEIARQTVPGDGVAHDVGLKDIQPGRYDITIYDQKAIFRMRMPADLQLAVTSPMMSADVAKGLSFYVPPGTKQFAIYAESVVPIVVKDGSGKDVAGEGTRLLRYTVPPGQAGKVWTISNFKSWVPLRLINVPQVISFSNEAALKPAEP